MAARIESQAEPIPGYRLIDRLGGGGFGEVWRAEAPGGLQKAIKFVYGDLGSVNENDQRAEQELKALNRVKTVRHPYILSLERVDIIDGQLIIVMELADRNLWDRYRECRAQGMPGIPRDELLRYVEETAEALDLMNGEYNLQHLDIKPQNIFLVHQHVKVADFGLVKDLEGMVASVTGGVTPVYAAPEIFDGKVSRFSDQYSLAIVYQELLTGQRPFAGANVRHLILQHMQAAPNLSSLPEADQPVVGRALSKMPAQRYPTCRELVALLRRNSNLPQAAAPARPADLGRNPLRAPDRPLDLGTDPPPPTNPDTPTQLLRQRTDTGPGLVRPAETASAVGEPSRSAPPEVHGEGCLFPALVIGLGQVGMLALQRVRAELTEHFHSVHRVPSLRLLLLDTDPEVIREATRGRPGAALSPNEVLLTPLSRPSHYLKPRDGKTAVESWLNPRMLYRIPRSQVPSGVRALGRLAFCDNYRAVVRRLQFELETLLTPEALQRAADETGLGLRSNRPRVYLLAALAGGTGSGMFLDLAYAVRARLKQLGYEQADVVGLFFLPPLEGHGSRSLTLGNTFAALTELRHYGTPGTTFEANYLERDGAVQDNEPPFTRTLLFPLPEESDDAGTRRLLGRAARLVFQEICSPLGRTVDLARAGLSAPPWAEHGLCYHSAGLSQIGWPRRDLLRTVARRLCQRLVQSWLSKDGKPVRQTAVSWVEEQWEARELGADHFLRQVNELCAASLGAPPDEMLQRALRPLTARLTNTVEKTAGGRGGWLLAGRAPQAPPELPPEAFIECLKCLDELIGRPGDEASEAVSQIVPPLRETIQRLAAEWGQKLTDLHLRLLERPGLRLAAAEEGIRHVVTAIEKILQHHEPLLRDLKEKADDSYARLQALAEGTGRRPLPQELLELLRSYPKWRYQSLVLQQTVTAFVGLRGHLSDELREVNFCRVRLTELLRLLERDETAADGETPVVAESAAGEEMFPGGCKNLQEAAYAFLGGLDGDTVPELDQRVQALVQEEFNAFVHVCLTTAATVLKKLEAAMRQVAETFAAEFLRQTDVAEMFLERYPTEEAALKRLGLAYEDAAPGAAPPGASPPAEFCVLAVPPGPAGERLRDWARRAMPHVEFVDGPDDTVLVYREVSHQALAGLNHLGPAARDAYRQMLAAEHFTPHTRIDVQFRP